MNQDWSDGVSGDNGAVQNPSSLTEALAALGGGEHIATLTAKDERSPEGY